jgi:Transposase, Mutator family
VQTAEGELQIEVPQVREAAETFPSKLFPRTPKLLRTEPLKALVIGAFVRGLSMRDVESLCEHAGLGKLSRSTASRICEELRERYEAFKRRSFCDIRLVALFLDATFISVRPSGPKEGVLVAWGFTEEGERVRLSVTLGMRESLPASCCAELPGPREVPRASRAGQTGSASARRARSSTSDATSPARSTESVVRIEGPAMNSVRSASRRRSSCPSSPTGVTIANRRPLTR